MSACLFDAKSRLRYGRNTIQWLEIVAVGPWRLFFSMGREMCWVGWQQPRTNKSKLKCVGCASAVAQQLSWLWNAKTPCTGSWLKCEWHGMFVEYAMQIECELISVSLVWCRHSINSCYCILNIATKIELQINLQWNWLFSLFFSFFHSISLFDGKRPQNDAN